MRQILDNAGKRTGHGEVFAVLFELCNLNCKFCTQDHTARDGMDNIVGKYEPIIEAVERQILFGRKDYFSIILMGGELFGDNVPDHIFEDYKKLINKMQSWFEDKDIPVSFFVLTNLVFTKTERVFNLLEQVPLGLNASYDPAGRFSVYSKELFEKNVELFKQHIINVGVTMTKPSIRKIMQGDPYFDYMHDNFNIDLDYYNPITDGGVHTDDYDKLEVVPSLFPTDTDLRDFFIFIRENYTKCFPANYLLSEPIGKTSCQDTAHILADNSIGRCIFKYKDEADYDNIKSKLEQKWFENHNCLECPFFDRCILGCFVSASQKGFRTQEACWLREVYEHIESENV